MIKRLFLLVLIVIGVVFMMVFVNSVPIPDGDMIVSDIPSLKVDASMLKSIAKYDDVVQGILNESIVFCINNSKAMVNNKLVDIDVNANLTPIETFSKGSSYSVKFGEAYIPIKFLMQSLGLSYNVSSNGVVYVNNKAVNSVYVKSDNSILYLSTAGIEFVTGKKYFRYGEIIIVSDERIVYNSQMIDYIREVFQSTKYPVIVNYYLYWESVSGYNGEGVRYKAFSNNQQVGELTAEQKLTLTSDKVYNYVSVAESLDKSKYTIQDKIVGIGNCDFDPYIRKASIIESGSEEYSLAIKDIKALIGNSGLSANTVIKEIYEFDLDGQNNKRLLINATNDFQVDGEYYSYFILRKVENDDIKDTFIYKSSTKQADFSDYHDYTVIDIMDVDNDGVLEAIICEALFESYKIKVLELDGIK